MELMETAFLLDSLSIYKNLRKDPVIKNLYNCIIKLYSNKDTTQQLEAVSLYSNMCHFLYESRYSGNLADYVFDLVLYDINIFSKKCAKNSNLKTIEKDIVSAASSDLNTLCKISALSHSFIKSAFKEKFLNSSHYLIDKLPAYSINHKSFPANGQWDENISMIANSYNLNGIGIYAKYKGFIFEESITPVKNLDPIKLDDLKQYEVQKGQIIDNTLSFLNGKPYNNILLYGDRGTGKSSTVKALLNEFSEKGLRIVELNKKSLFNFGKLLSVLQDIPLKFIVFIDDLTFNENDNSFGILKAALEGSIGARPTNVAIYATSNRRHLIKENFSSREGNEVHKADTIDENMSLSDRFGLVVTFMKPNKDDFLKVVKELALDNLVDIDEETLFDGAEKFAIKKGGRTPRLAKQYINYLLSKESLDI